jgi:hypothetical protein
MRTSRRKKAFCIFLTIIIGINVSFTLFSSLFINSLPKNTFDLDNPNRSAGEITITTPENRTYFEPMAGYYPATHGFENEVGGTSGTAIEYVDVTTISSGCEVQIYEEYQGHKKVLRLHDGNTAGGARAQHDFSSTQTSGYVEWWWNTPVSGSSGMAYHFHEGSLGTHAGTVVMKDGYFLDMEGYIIQSYVANRWYHHKIAFDTIFDQYDWYIDGILVVNDGNFENHVSNFGSTNIKGGWTSTGSCYIDAIGLSWDSDYSVGDNLKEGLLISYTNNTNFDWIGYSLDGSSNITITEIKVIPLPENGIHSIVLNGITSTGTSIQSDVRYFTINFQEPPLPPKIPEPLNFVPIILNSMGIGIIFLLSITLFLFINNNKTQKRT